jgi:hypothetical protein
MSHNSTPPEIDPSATSRFGTLAPDDRVRRTTVALEANGFTVFRAANLEDAKRIVLSLIPEGAQDAHLCH